MGGLQTYWFLMWSTSEGAFAVWEQSELNNILGREHAQVFCYHFDVKPSGNVDPASDIQGELADKVIIVKIKQYFYSQHL